jgi:maltose alpha-D-glucosyltransferase/alpha-amylase
MLPCRLIGDKSQRTQAFRARLPNRRKTACGSGTVRPSPEFSQHSRGSYWVRFGVGPDWERRIAESPVMAKRDHHRFDTDTLWYRDAVIYQLHVKSFFDSNNDGVGDFPGLVAKLDYLSELGVNAIWMLPFYPSPRRDDGYDIADYKNVHPEYGGLADVRRLIAEAHARGIRVITELVVNHTSDRHPWFQRARHARAGSAARDFYVWSDDDKKYAGTRIIFLDTEKSNWTWDDVAKAYYWHRFYSHQPDLNFDNPRVLEAVLGVMRFWLDLGVDGLRLDAVPYLVEREGTNNENLPETHAILKRIRAEVDAHYPWTHAACRSQSVAGRTCRPISGTATSATCCSTFP